MPLTKMVFLKTHSKAMRERPGCGSVPFALSRIDSDQPWIDPGPPPFLGTATDAEFKSNLVAVIRSSSQLTTEDGVTIDISPATIGNNTLGTNDGHGYTTNPVTGQPYATNLVLRGDFTRSLTEFWADGPSSETPPGHWNVIANNVSDVMPVKRIGGDWAGGRSVGMGREALFRLERRFA